MNPSAGQLPDQPQPLTTTVPGRIQTAFDTTVTSATSPLALYTVPGGYVLYLDYVFVYCYAFTAGTGAAIGWQLVIDQGVTGFSCAFVRGYKLQDQFAITFKKPLLVQNTVSFVALGPAGANATFSAFVCLGGDCV